MFQGKGREADRNSSPAKKKRLYTLMHRMVPACIACQHLLSDWIRKTKHKKIDRFSFRFLTISGRKCIQGYLCQKELSNIIIVENTAV